MRSILTFLPGLACAGGMAAMMWMMTRSSNRSTDSAPERADADRQLAELRDEVARLRGEVGSPPVEPPAR